MYIIIWEYQIKPENQPEFESIYSPKGAWAELFENSPGFLVLQRDFILLRDFDPYYETLPLRGFSVCGCNLERVRLR